MTANFCCRILLLTFSTQQIDILYQSRCEREVTLNTYSAYVKKITTTVLLIAGFIQAYAQVNVTIDMSVDAHRVSPYLYGRNNSLSDNPGSPLSTADWTRLKDSGLTFLRENGGNNSTKYNWRRKLSSHPDWYNNVYPHNWDFAAQSMLQNLPGVQGMWAFQLIGKAAKTTSANFNDWGYNGSQWWSGVNQNLAGGGVVNASGGANATTNGNPDLYLENWTADSTVLILDHWFNKLGLQQGSLVYWNMDNEIEIWEGTHDDVMPAQESAENFMQRYFAVAKKARQLFPGIKLVGAVPANEWQWYNWSGGITQGGKKYPWLEYFIKRVAEEQQASEVRLLDVLDIHFYPGSTSSQDIVQYHRVFFDKNYSFPEANGVKNVTGTWDNSQTKEYIFERCKEWLDQYIGAGHGVTFGVSETGIPWVNANTSAVWYAGMLGEFMRHPEMELFSPWSWQTGMWEVLHLYARYNKTQYVKGNSSDETSVSAYPTINEDGDSVTIVLVNRATTSKTTTVTFNGFDLADQSFQVLRLSNLTGNETFISHSANALQKSTVSPSANALSLALPSMSVTTVLLKGTKGETVTGIDEEAASAVVSLYPNPTNEFGTVTIEIKKPGMATLDLIDVTGKRLKNIFYRKGITNSFKEDVELSEVSSGVYLFKLQLDNMAYYKKIIVAH
jgi:hypothetical protein